MEAAERVLPNLPERVSRATEVRLRQLGVEIHTGKEVSQVMADGIQTTDGRFLPCRMKVWAAGIKAPDILKELDGLEVSRLNRLVVRPTLQTSTCDDVFALGDCAECPWPEHDRTVPPRANAAHQQAALLAKSLVRRQRGKTAAGVRIQGSRFTRVTQSLHHPGHSDGKSVRRHHVRRLVGTARLPVAISDASESGLWLATHASHHAGGLVSPRRWSGSEAPLIHQGTGSSVFERGSGTPAGIKLLSGSPLATSVSEPLMPGTPLQWPRQQAVEVRDRFRLR